MPFEWTPDREDLLRTYWQAGMVASEIGRRLGCTKNSAVGKAHRLHLDKRPSPIKRHGTPSKRKERIEPPPARKRPKPAKLNGLKGCQWIEGEPSADDACKCGMRRRPGSVYCWVHHRRAYR